MSTQQDVVHSQEEHVEAEQLLERLRATNPESEAFDNLLEEVVDSVTHHIEDEESTVLPGMRERLTEARRRELGEAFLTVRGRVPRRAAGRSDEGSDRRRTPATERT